MLALRVTRVALWVTLLVLLVTLVAPQVTPQAQGGAQALAQPGWVCLEEARQGVGLAQGLAPVTPQVRVSLPAPRVTPLPVTALPLLASQAALQVTPLLVMLPVTAPPLAPLVMMPV
jgi:hypothetical protein